MTQESGWIMVLDLNVCHVDQPKPVDVAGKELIIFRYGDRYVAMDRWCPHRNGDLTDGRIIGRALKCPLHGFMFSVENGLGVNCGDFHVKVHEVQVENGQLSVRLA
jgi:nitrite reductase/ring-hydroxylating ferredoxin subunit